MVDIAPEYFPQSALNRDSPLILWQPGLNLGLCLGSKLCRLLCGICIQAVLASTVGMSPCGPRAADQRKFWKSESYFSSDGPAPGGNGGSSLNSGHTPKSARCPDSACCRNPTLS